MITTTKKEILWYDKYMRKLLSYSRLMGGVDIGDSKG